MFNIDFSLNNGLGKPAISVYYSGCDIPVKCNECHNPELWNKTNSKVEYKELHRLIKGYSEHRYSDNLTIAFLGGDPLAVYNRDSVMETSRKLKEDFPDAELILYSWRLPEQIEENWVKDFDFGVLGQFDIDKFRKDYLPASTNQIIYNFKTKETMAPIRLNA